MIELRDEPDTNVIELTVDGAISEADFDDIITRVEEKIQTHGDVRVLEHVRSVGSFPMSRVWQDLKFATRHRRDFSRAAVVGNQRWLGPVTRLSRLFFDGDVRHFPERQLDAARAWVRNEVTPPP